MNKLVMERLYKFVKDRDIALKYIDGLKDKYEDFNKALYECNTQLEISDFLDIELEYVEKRLGYLKISCPIHTLTENLAVNLYKLPEIYKIDLTHLKRVVFE